MHACGADAAQRKGLPGVIDPVDRAAILFGCVELETMPLPARLSHAKWPCNQVNPTYFLDAHLILPFRKNLHFRFRGQLTIHLVIITVGTQYNGS